MGFWIFMLVCSLATPILMILCGWIFQNHPPGQINSIYGYRTKMSMLSMETWDYAHRYFGRRWLRAGWMLIPATLLCMLPIFGKSDFAVGLVGSIVVTMQLIVLLVPIMWTERELRRKFGPDGRRRP